MVGQQYRRLRQGEIIREGDEVLEGICWNKSRVIGEKVGWDKDNGGMLQYRRPTLRKVAKTSTNKRSPKFPRLWDIVKRLALTKREAIVAGKVYAEITRKLRADA
jgi:hypothetical protein